MLHTSSLSLELALGELCFIFLHKCKARARGESPCSGGKFKLISKMPREYIKKGARNQWTDGQLEAAKKAVRSGEMSLRTASEKYGVPRTTLSNHLRGISTKRYGGPPTVLTPAEEIEIVASCQVLQEIGFPLTKDHVSAAIKSYLTDHDKLYCFKDGVPGYDWWVGFFKRHPSLTQRKPEHLPTNRAKAATPEVRYIQYTSECASVCTLLFLITIGNG